MERDPPDLTLPVALLGLAVVAWLGSTAGQLLRDRGTLAATLERQTPAMQDGDRVRQQLEALFAGATDLAAGGNAPARAALDVLQKQGVTYNAKR